MSPRAVGLALLLALTAGCAAPENLELVPHQGAVEAKPQPVFHWEARFDVADAELDAEIVAWVPLPQSTEAQGVRSLLYQLGPPGVLSEERTPAGDRLLQVRATRAVLGTLRVSARFERRSLMARDLPPALIDLDRSGPEVWVRAAQAVGATARLAHGVRLQPNRPGQPCRWPELKRDGEWVAVDLERGRLRQRAGHLRLATVRPRATLNGKPVPIRARHVLTQTN